MSEGNGTLLDNSLYLYGSGMGNPNIHNHVDLPIVVAGGAAGKVRGGRHIKYDEPAPLANLHLTMLDAVGVRLDSFQDSTGKIDTLYSPVGLCRLRSATSAMGAGNCASPESSLLCWASSPLRRGSGSSAVVRGAQADAPLAAAVQRNDRAAIRQLLDKKAGINARAARRHDGAALGDLSRRSSIS